ncbi:type IX secretion system sortase PorU [Fulvivirgaceae bacterium BMA10]|uniref:Type IX secretion system sortase PorU n=1 Tax=Splendidivirga corallicola TaxID=3051826 RepID=A0ABT8KPM1_9BACT|nr:type IX secretion system sortase PorU [Fulvivirgaceae bacterium BMA10]
MSSRKAIFSACISLILSIPLYAQQQTNNSVLSDGQFYKFAIKKNGVYKLTYEFLEEVGVDVELVDPKQIKVYGNGGGMLPQKSSTFRYTDLIENPILVIGEDDGVFDREDYILFYGEGSSKHFYDAENALFRTTQHLYDTANYYFLNISDKPGKRITTVHESQEKGVAINTFNDFIYHESELINVIGSGRLWFGEELNDENPNLQFQYNIPGLLDNSQISLDVAVMSRSNMANTFNFQLNNLNVGSLKVASVNSLTYGKQAETNDGIFEMTNQGINDVIKFAIQYDDPSGNSGYLDHFNINFERRLQLYEGQTIFRSIGSTQNDISEFIIDQVHGQCLIWDITDPLKPKKQDFSLSGSSGSFSTATEKLKEFVVFDPLLAEAPDFIENVNNQNLHSLAAPNLLIIINELFFEEAQRLADFRKKHDGLSVEVVQLDQIYNEFSSGKQDVSAIRDFIRLLYKKDNNLKYVLLFGDASYDYKNVNEGNTNFVPTYQSRNSLHNVHSYVSDDYFGFLEDHEGEWIESNFINNHDLDVGVGRLPITTTQEAKLIVDKLIHYSAGQESLGDWRTKIAFVADDGNASKFQYQSDYLASFVEDTYKNYTADRVFIDAFPKVKEGNFTKSQEVRQRINEHLDNGVLILDYIGHGGETAWTNDGILDIEMVKGWENWNNLPIFLTATCEFGRFDEWQRRSGAEHALLNPKGGTIALLTTSRPVFINTNFDISKAFYESVLEPIEGAPPRLGDIMRKTKNAAIAGINNRNFTLLGDPSMQLAYPKEEIVITKVNNIPASGELTLDPLSKITISGEVRNRDLKDEHFNGVLEIQVFGEKSEVTTLGNDGNPVMSFKNWEDILFKGKFSVKNGHFEFDFILPGSLTNGIQNGRISLYAKHNDNIIDAAGSREDVLISDRSGPVTDVLGPEIKLFIDHKDFKSGGNVSNNIKLIAELLDESGINTSELSGKGIKAILDGDETNIFHLNDFYETSLDNVTEGHLQFPINDIVEGKHFLRLEASDLFGNTSSKTIEFNVVEEGTVLLQNLEVFPNPSRYHTDFSFTFKNPGEELKVIILIYNSHGKVIKVIEETLTDLINSTQTIRWDRTDDRGRVVKSGIYVYAFYFRSIFNRQASKRGKIMVMD